MLKMALRQTGIMLPYILLKDIFLDHRYDAQLVVIRLWTVLSSSSFTIIPLMEMYLVYIAILCCHFHHQVKKDRKRMT